jgi:hypothetical protein
MPKAKHRTCCISISQTQTLLYQYQPNTDPAVSVSAKHRPCCISVSRKAGDDKDVRQKDGKTFVAGTGQGIDRDVIKIDLKEKSRLLLKTAPMTYND